MDIDYHYKLMSIHSQILIDFSSYSKIEIKDVQGESDIPVIEMYTYGSDLYISKGSGACTFGGNGAADELVIEEEYVVLESAKKMWILTLEMC